MPSVLIFGGSGNLAGFIIERLVTKSFVVYAVIRREEHISRLEELGAKPVVQSLEDSTVTELSSLIQTYSPDSIIFAAGGGWRALQDPTFNKIVDQDAAIKVFDAIEEANATKRLVHISTIDVRNRLRPRPSWYNDEDQKSSDHLWQAIPKYMEVKFAADKDLVEQNERRKLEYTIIKPTWYGDGGRTGKVEAGKVGMAPKVSREDVADIFVECVENPGTIGCIFEVVGGETPIKEAVQRVVDGKINSFGEQYR